jgi:hypothetical protein
VSNLILYLVCVVAPAGALYLATRLGDLTRLCTRLYRRVRPMQAAPSAVSIERVAADLRRVARVLEGYQAASPAISMVKWRGAQLAYEDRLADACRALDIPQQLAETTAGMHEFEVRRVERALLRAGLAFTPPWGGSGGPVSRFAA